MGEKKNTNPTTQGKSYGDLSAGKARQVAVDNVSKTGNQ